MGLEGEKKEDQIVLVQALYMNTPLNGLFAKGGRKDIILAA